jgi:hypothetical protein
LNNAEQHSTLRTTLNNGAYMIEQKYRATLSGESGRSGWCVIFRHPLRRNPDETPVRVRRGLGTREKTEAEVLVAQMNQILADSTFWNPQAKARAEALFHPKIVSAFYDDLLPEARDPWALRNEVIPMPGQDQGYARGRMLGTTGGGKTTVMRQFLGTDPKTERFPSTSTAKTTVCDIEVIFGPAPFQAVVTFFSEDYVRLHIEECVLASAASSVFEKAEAEVCAAKLLEHSEQRFRLSYILGNVSAGSGEELSDDEDLLVEAEPGENAEVSAEERAAMAGRIEGFVARIGQISAEAARKLESVLGVNLRRTDGKDESAFQELFEVELRQSDEFHKLVDEILDAVKERFELLDGAGFRRERDWPLLWQFECGDRGEFIRTVNRFSSNYAPNFGRLLTPLVQGMRVKGPFAPAWHDGGDLKLVLMDGEGFGHTPESSASISTTITERFKDADAIVLVDSAEQPMQAAPQALLRTLASSGQEGKLIVAFTHLDEVKGDNLPNIKARKLHVQRSLDNAIGKVGEVLGGSAENAIRRAASDRTFFLSKIDEPIKAGNKLTLAELRRMLTVIQDSIKPRPPAYVIPVYDVTNLILGIPLAVGTFRDPWRARLGFPSESKISPVHWAKIKALARRFAELGQIEYSDLMPVADMITALRERLSVVLALPLKWEPENAPEEMKRQVVNEILGKVAGKLEGLGKSRLFQERTKEWSKAYYEHSGRGSTRDRARDIDNIYDTAAPTPTDKADENASNFVAAIRTIVKEAVEAADGRFV